MNKEKLRKEYKKQFYSYDKGILFNPKETFNWILNKMKDDAKMTKGTNGDYTLYYLNEKIKIFSDTPHSDALRTIIMEVINSYLETMSKSDKKEFLENYFKANLYNYLPNL